MHYNRVKPEITELKRYWSDVTVYSYLYKRVLYLRSIELFAESKILKEEGVYIPLHEVNWEKCLKISEFYRLLYVL